jgi:hypothetical protein
LDKEVGDKVNKGIIMEVNTNYAIIMNNDGSMDKIAKKKHMLIGQKIFYFEDDIIKSNNVRTFRTNSFMKTIGSIAALFLIAFTFFYQLSYKESAYAVVSLDINPSIQIEVDSNKNILKVEGMNDDGKNIDFKNLKGLDINVGIQKIKEILVEKNYVIENRDVLVAFALVDEDENKAYEESVIGAIKSNFTEKVTYVKGNKEDVEEAKTAGISLGRYEVFKVVDEESKKQIDKAPVKDITELIKDNENVIQWGTDENNQVIKVPGSEVVDEALNDDVPVNNNTNSNNNSNTSEEPKRPTIDVPSDNNNINTNTGNQNSSIVKPDDDPIIDIKPDPKPEEITPKEEEIPDKEVETPGVDNDSSDEQEDNNDSEENDNLNEDVKVNQNSDHTRF